jgi:hypothetical protein
MKPKLEVVEVHTLEPKPIAPERKSALQNALDFLGDKWLLSPKHSPKKGDYSGWPKK